jgi:hypothetical protein
MLTLQFNADQDRHKARHSPDNDGDLLQQVVGVLLSMACSHVLVSRASRVCRHWVHIHGAPGHNMEAKSVREELQEHMNAHLKLELREHEQVHGTHFLQWEEADVD